MHQDQLGVEPADERLYVGGSAATTVGEVYWEQDSLELEHVLPDGVSRCIL